MPSFFQILNPHIFQESHIFHNSSHVRREEFLRRGKERVIAATFVGDKFHL
jgi:hypothetical protein